MVSGLLIALAAAVANGFLAVVYEIGGKKKYNVFEFVLYMQGIGFTFGLALSLKRGLPLFNPAMISLGLITSVLYIVAVSSYLMATRERNIGASWTVLNLSLALPVAVSLIYFRDKLDLAKGLGFLGVVAAMTVIGSGSEAEGATRGGLNSRWAWWIMLAFATNGCTLTIFRFVPATSAPLFTLYFFGLSSLIVLFRKLFIRSAPPPGLLWLCLAGAASMWTGISLTILALSIVGHVSSNAGVVVYPISNGLAIPIGVLLGSLLLRQQISRRAWIGVALGAFSLICLAV